MPQNTRQPPRLHVPARKLWRAEEARRESSETPSPLLAVPLARPVELVWRAHGSAATGGAVSPAATMSASPSHATRAFTSATPPVKSERSVVWATAFDPALAERFADDVIRRIDRRARIERERRGL
jgi:hypothetical protein